jgi:glyoxylase-like metal-dependent hydrolase (beta-lactamase superfamily II)
MRRPVSSPAAEGEVRRPLYHLLDPVWSRIRLPYRSCFSVERVGAVSVVRMARAYFGRELQPVYCYAIGDTLVDTGLASQGDALACFAADAGIRRALLTHHHEDHAGNAARLGDTGVSVLAGGETAALVARDLPIRFYQHFLWGKARPARAAPFGDALRIGRHRAVVVPAPGHCQDQVAFHVPEEGWLFSGDAFLHERVKVFRADEDFAATVATLDRFLALDFEALFCAHRPRPTGGKEAIRQKLAWLRDVEGRVRALHVDGVPAREIARRIVPKRATLDWITMGDASTESMVRSILHGPVPRPEVIAAAREAADGSPG